MVPFWARCLIVLGLMVVGAALDRWKRGPDATRPREYSFLLVCGLLGAAFAIGVDHVDATLSPDYFVIGKGLRRSSLRLDVTWLGFQAGLAPGLIVGGLLLLANQPIAEKPVISSPRLLRFALIPIAAALAFALAGALLNPRFDVFDDARALEGELSPERLERFLLVHGVHLGLYAGGGLGAIAAAILARRSR
jgi:hypothetical protein